MSESLRVTLEVTANKPSNELPAKQQLDTMLARALNSMVRDLGSGTELARALSLPMDVPILFEVRVVPRNGSQGANGHIPMRASLTGFPATLEKVRVVEEKINDLIFAHIRHIKPPQDLSAALGYNTDHSAEFHLAFDTELPEAMSPQEMLAAADCAPGSSFSWGKGCNSWPW